MKIHTETIDYKQGDTTLEGLLARPDSTGKHPGILIVHQWAGITDYEKMRAKMLAEMGYVAFCADIYGKNIRPKTVQDCAAQATKFRGADRALLRARVNAGLDELKRNQWVDPNRVAAMGYCFGGTTVLELARSGAALNGVVSFHGGLDSPTPADGKNIKCKLLVLAGADDPFQKPEDLAAFEKEMRDAKVDWQIVFYGGAVHAFTQSQVDKDNIPGAKYDERADQRSWRAMKDFFAEIFQ